MIESGHLIDKGVESIHHDHYLSFRLDIDVETATPPIEGCVHGDLKTSRRSSQPFTYRVVPGAIVSEEPGDLWAWRRSKAAIDLFGQTLPAGELQQPAGIALVL